MTRPLEQEDLYKHPFMDSLLKTGNSKFRIWLKLQHHERMAHICDNTPIKKVFVEDILTTIAAHNIAKVANS